MKLEATGKAFTYRWPGGEVHLEQGKPIDLPDDRGKRLLDKAAGKVRMVAPTIRPGDKIAWGRAGVTQVGTVDFIHTDSEGGTWAFTTGGDWSAINTKFARLATAEDIEAATNRAAPACFACGATGRWLSINGAVVCVVCHPPVHLSLIKSWVGPDDRGDDCHGVQQDQPGDVVDGDEEPIDAGPA